jgi:hypothetical protein
MPSYRFKGAPMINEATEFGHKAIPIYTTLRDLTITIGGTIVFAGIGYAFSAWIGLLIGLISTVTGLLVTQQLRKNLGNPWPWELIHRLKFIGDERGYIGGGRRRFTPIWINGQPQFVLGNGRGLTVIADRGLLHSPFGRRRIGTEQTAMIARHQNPFPELSHDP